MCNLSSTSGIVDCGVHKLYKQPHDSLTCTHVIHFLCLPDAGIVIHNCRKSLSSLCVSSVISNSHDCKRHCKHVCIHVWSLCEDALRSERTQQTASLEQITLCSDDVTTLSPA